MAKSTPLFVGLDVHKIRSRSPMPSWGQSADPRWRDRYAPGGTSTKLIRRLQAKTPTLVFAYEAGPCGSPANSDLRSRGTREGFCDVRSIACWALASL